MLIFAEEIEVHLLKYFVSVWANYWVDGGSAVIQLVVKSKELPWHFIRVKLGTVTIHVIMLSDMVAGCTFMSIIVKLIEKGIILF